MVHTFNFSVSYIWGATAYWSYQSLCALYIHCLLKKCLLIDNIIILVLILVPLRSQALDESQLNPEAFFFSDLKSETFHEVSGALKIGDDLFYWEYPSRLITLPNVGQIPRPASKIHAIKRSRSKIIFNRIYTNDEYGRRISLINPSAKQSSSVLFAGCSFVYGDGIPDHETLHHFFNSLESSYYAVNYGISGGAINNILAQLMLQENFSSQLPVPPLHLVYIYIPSHVSRVAGTWPSTWSLVNPFFIKNKKDEMTFAGSIFENTSWLRRRALELAELLPDWVRRDRFIPRITSYEQDYFCDLVKATEAFWKKQSPDGRFVFMYHPTVSPEPWLDNCLNKRGISSVKFDIDGDQSNFEIPGDGHPTGVLNQLFAKKLVEYLSKL